MFKFRILWENVLHYAITNYLAFSGFYFAQMAKILQDKHF